MSLVVSRVRGPRVVVQPGGQRLRVQLALDRRVAPSPPSKKIDLGFSLVRMQFKSGALFQESGTLLRGKWIPAYITIEDMSGK